MRRDHTEAKRRAEIRGAALIAITTAILGGTVLAIAATGDGAQMKTETEAVLVTETPYYMTEEYQQMKRQEEEQNRKEAEELRESIERYYEETQKQQEQEFIKAREQWYKELEVESDGFIEYEIPEEYAQDGGSFPADIQRYAWEQCQENGIEYTKYIALIEQESGYRADCEGADGDIGYAQVIPRYNKELLDKIGCTDMTDPYENIKASTVIFGELLRKYDGSYEKALTAYNAGCTGAYKYWFSAGVDASPYAKKVLRKAGRIEAEMGGGRE